MNGKGATFVGGLVLGTLVGSAAALLSVSQSGGKTRVRIHKSREEPSTKAERALARDMEGLGRWSGGFEALRDPSSEALAHAPAGWY
jgi:gas vesicle protein